MHNATEFILLVYPRASASYYCYFHRYSTFIILYPVGVTGELLCCYAAQKETKIFTIELPIVNFLINYQRVMWILMLLYIPRK